MEEASETVESVWRTKWRMSKFLRCWFSFCRHSANNPFIYVLDGTGRGQFYHGITGSPLRRVWRRGPILTGVLIILTMVSLSGLLRFWQELASEQHCAERWLAPPPRCCVVGRQYRRGAKSIPIEELVPAMVFLAAICARRRPAAGVARSLYQPVNLVVNHYP